MRPFDRVPFIVYSLSSNMLFEVFFGLSWANLLVNLIFPEVLFDPRKNDIIYVLGCMFLLPYAVGELLYRLKNAIVKRLTPEQKEKVNKWGENFFYVCTCILFFLLTVFSHIGYATGQEMSASRLVYQKFQSSLKSERKMEFPPEAALPMGYERYKVIQSDGILAFHDAGQDQLFNTVDDILCLRYDDERVVFKTDACDMPPVQRKPIALFPDVFF